MEETNLKTENKEVQTGNTENQVVEKEMPVCRSAEALRNVGMVFLILFFILLFVFIICLVLLGFEIRVGGMTFVTIGSSMFSCIIFWAFARAVADIAESTYIMARK